jgi:hypothetical protein
MIRKVLLYGLPLYLYLLEAFLKTIASVTSESLLGPTLAGAGIGFLLPLTEFKQVEIDANLASELQKSKAFVYSTSDKILVDFVWLAFLISLGAWMYSVFLTFHPKQVPLNTSPLVIGCVVFVISLILAEIKERL